MNNNPRACDQETVIELPGRPNFLVLLIATLSIMIVAIIILLAVNLQLDAAVGPLLVCVAISCCGLVVIAMQHTFAGQLTVTKDGLTIERLFSTRFYDWRTIKSFEVTPATATFGDTPFADADGRIGAGIRLQEDAGGADEEQVDVIIAAGDSLRAVQMMQLVEKIKSLQVRNSTMPPPSKRARRARQANQRKQFRSQPNFHSAA